jgi:hypothetical protein
MAVSKRLRYEVLRRDNHACRYCGVAAPDAKLTVDHVVPTSLGGSDKADNLVAACVDCNSGKSSSNPDAPLVDVASADALRWGRAVAQAAEAMTTRLEDVRDTQDAFLTVWEAWTYGPEDDSRHIPLDPNWKDSLDALLKRGLPLKVVNECVDIAMRRDSVHVDNKFKYFCGVAWRKVDELVESAKAIYEVPPQLNLPDPAAWLTDTPYRDAVHMLYGVMPDAFLDNEDGYRDGMTFRELLAAEFDDMHEDDEDEHGSPIDRSAWPPELKAFAAMVHRMREFMLQGVQV